MIFIKKEENNLKKENFDFFHTNADMNITDITVVYEFTPPVQSWKYAPSSYPDSVLSFILEGEALYYVNEEKIKVSKNMVIFLPSGISFHSRGLKGNFHYFSIKFSMTNNRLIKPFQKPYIVSNPRYFHNAFINMREKWERKGFGYKLEIKSILYDVISKLITEDVNYEDSFKNYHLVKKSIKYMEENYFNSDLNIEKIASASNITSAYFRNLFKEIYGISPVKHINKIRLEKAKELLEFSREPIYKIGEKTGFSSVYHFERTFKQNTGLTPTQYRMSVHSKDKI